MMLRLWCMTILAGVAILHVGGTATGAEKTNHREVSGHPLSDLGVVTTLSRRVKADGIIEFSVTVTNTTSFDRRIETPMRRMSYALVGHDGTLPVRIEGPVRPLAYTTHPRRDDAQEAWWDIAPGQAITAKGRFALYPWAGKTIPEGEYEVFLFTELTQLSVSSPQRVQVHETITQDSVARIPRTDALPVFGSLRGNDRVMAFARALIEGIDEPDSPPLRAGPKVGSPADPQAPGL